MYMKLTNTNIIIAVVIFVFIFSSICFSCSNVLPYSENSVFAKQFPYEGFSQLADLEYTTNPEHKVTDSQSYNNVSVECSKVYGFDGLYCKPYVADNKLDVFSEVEGKPSCVGSSSGLSNSQGGLCLNQVQKSLLSTRGGNSTGKTDEIGK